MLLSSCRETTDGFAVVGPSGADAGGNYHFEANLNDSTALYSTFIAARLDSRDLENRSGGEDFILTVTVKSPKGESYAERISLPLKKVGDLVRTGNRTGGTVDIEWPYRDSIRVKGRETGIWVIELHPEKSDRLFGIGFSYKKNTDNGKR